MFKPTNLEWDNYMDYLLKAINKSKFNKRSEIKPMSTPKGAEESHLTSRANHQRLAAEISKQIAEKLGLNTNYIYVGMLMHDAGHPFSAHEGEEIFNIIGRIYNTGYFHHNAKGVEVILSEDICSKAINMIPDIENNPELRQRLEDEFYSFLDVVISHDGEATKKDMKKQADEYPSIKEAVLTKLRLSNSFNNYKFIAQDMEGRIGKVADVLAYLPTDIQDGFRLGIVNNFDDEYLEAFGTMFSEEEGLTREEKIAFAKSMLDKVKKEKLRELKSDMKSPENQSILKYVDETIQEAQNYGLNIDALTDEERDRLDEIIESKIESIKKSTVLSSDEEEQMLYSDMMKFREFMAKMTRITTDVVEEITGRMEEYFINDIIQNSQTTGKLEFSQKADDLYYRMKGLNYKHIVQYTKWDYQNDGQPEAAKELIDICKIGLMQSGTIRDKFYDRSIRKYIIDEEALSYMRTPKRDESKYQDYKRRIGMIRVPAHLHRYTESNPKKLRRYELLRNVSIYAKKEGENFAIKYMNVFNAIPHTVQENVEYALDDKVASHDFLHDFQVDSNNQLRNRMIEEYGSLEEARARQQEFVERLIHEERSKMEEKMAIQLSIDYLSGMTDRSFNNLAIKTGFMTYEQIFEAKRSLKPSESVLKHISNLEESEQEEQNEKDELEL